MTGPSAASSRMEEAAALAREVAAAGASMGLPFIAATDDIGSPTPMRAPDGQPFAGTLFRWLDPELRYWEDRVVALRAAFVNTARVCAEPFYFAGQRLGSWRENPALEAINAEGPIDSWGVGAAIVAPAHRASGTIGVVIWASDDPAVDAAGLFAGRAAELHALALRFTATYGDAMAQTAGAPARLTPREIQCLKWAAAGKTDQEVGDIVRISLPTVRFHLNNAARKLQVVGRSQAVHRAATLGYIGAGPSARRAPAAG